MKNNIRVANVIEEGRLGGPQVRIANVALALKPYLETTVVLPFDNSNLFMQKLDNFNINYKCLNLSRITKDFKVACRYVLFSIFEIYKLSKYFKKEKFDLIHASGGSWQYKAVIAAKLSNGKVVWHLNDTSMPWLFRKIFLLFSSFPDAYIFSSERTKIYYSHIILEQKMSFIIPAPVDTEQFSENLINSSYDEIFNEWKGKTVVGVTANLSTIKGLDIFIQVASELNSCFPNMKFIIVGSVGDKKSALYKNLIKLKEKLNVDNLSFVGQVSDLRIYLKRMDVYVCSSYAESSPISVWEAMSMSKPIVSTDVGDVSKYIVNGESGYIVPVGSVRAIKNKVSCLLNNPELLGKFGDEARKVAERNLDIKICAEKHLSAYKKIISL